MSLPAKACPLLLLSATAIACSHTHPAATPADASALRLTVQPDPHVELGALVPGSLPLARVYNVTQAARIAGRAAARWTAPAASSRRRLLSAAR